MTAVPLSALAVLLSSLAAGCDGSSVHPHPNNGPDGGYDSGPISLDGGPHVGGSGGSGGLGGAGGSDVSEARSQPLQSELARQVQTAGCANIGTCAGYQFWRQTPTWIMDQPVGDLVICVYNDAGQQVGERVCSLGTSAACPTYSLFLGCHTVGVVPFDPSDATCDGTETTAPASICSDGGAPDSI